MRKPYPSDLTDEQWATVEPLIRVKTRMGRPRMHSMREVVNALLYLKRSGCQWDMLPHDLPAKSTVYNHFSRWRNDGTWQQILDALGQQDRVVAVGGSRLRPVTEGVDLPSMWVDHDRHDYGG
jgi:putative transposase